MAHAIRIITAPEQRNSPPHTPDPGPPDFVSELLEERIQKNVLPEKIEALPNSATPMRKVDRDNEPTRFEGVRRFDDEEQKDVVIAQIEGRVAADAEWYVIQYHECWDDRSGERGCDGWQTIRQDGPVPSEYNAN